MSGDASAEVRGGQLDALSFLPKQIRHPKKIIYADPPRINQGISTLHCLKRQSFPFLGLRAGQVREIQF